MKSANTPLAMAMPALFWATASLAAPNTEEEDLALVYGDKNTVSIATGSPQALSRAPSTATVITAEDIAAMGATNLDEVLETVPGMHVSRSSIRYASAYVIRGIGGGSQTNPQVLVLQNGIPATTMYANDKGYAWFGVPVENIARVEIIRGPGSALYGADAYAGVINVITKTATDIAGTKLGARGGSFNTWNTWAQHGGKWGDVDVAAHLNIGATDGIKEIIQTDAQTANDRRFGTHASLAPGPVNTGYDAIDSSLNLSYDKWRVRAAYKLRDNLETGAGISSALDPNSRGRAENISGDISWTDPQIARDWSVGVIAAMQYYASTQPNNLQLYPPGTKLGATTFPNGLIGGPNSWERQLRFSGNATYSGFEGHSLRFGVGHDDLDLYRVKTVNNFILSQTGAFELYGTGEATDITGIQPHIRPHRRQVNYFYAQDEWNFARDWTLTAGVRHDRYSDFGDTTNPRVALVWDATVDLTAKLLYGQAFRAPSFAEQYGTNPVVNGNPNLEPETIQTLEMAFSWQARRDTQVNLSLFHYQMKNIIRLVQNTAPAVGSTYHNTGNQHGNGLELETVWDANDALRLTGNYSYQQSIDDVTRRDTGYAAHHHIYARADWRFYEQWAFSTQLNWVGERKRSTGDNRAQIPDNTTLDLTLRSTLAKNQWDLAASVRNLFDATVLEPSLAPGTAIPNDLPMAPRSFYLQASYRF
ncbi:MAG: TonB-dependent receptor [Methylococcaceae bacterium]|nr:TonB-dependent receptor [Methylococcaceae bacterium]